MIFLLAAALRPNLLGAWRLFQGSMRMSARKSRHGVFVPMSREEHHEFRNMAKRMKKPMAGLLHGAAMKMIEEDSATQTAFPFAQRKREDPDQTTLKFPGV